MVEGFYSMELGDVHALVYVESVLLKEHWLFSSLMHGMSLLLEFLTLGWSL